ncbi:hypothetical protein BX666DRAFT_1986962 [Dichotomocladium elegans]|nr:hypothetical protein BX666DRAFT_1986962 [Dichotomocladium elegans]
MPYGLHSTTLITFYAVIFCFLTLVQAAQNLQCPIPGGKSKAAVPGSYCTSYYSCNGNTPQSPVGCPGGSQFDNEKQKCDVVPNFQCSST